MNNWLVVPSIRQNCLDKFIENWQKAEPELIKNLIVIEDNPCKTFNLNIEHHYSWKEIDADLGENSWIISRRDSAIRSYGYLIAWRLGAEYTFTLDDDCFYEEPFLQTHLNKLNCTSKWTELILGMRTRGIPYQNKGILRNVVANIGLWTNVPDYDSIQALTIPSKRFQPPDNVDRILPRGQYGPFCGMNCCFKREVAPLLYFALMGKNSPFNRFDDIWFGIIFKKICDHLNLNIAVGHPFVHHARASDPFVNLVKEAPGIQKNEIFWEIIDQIHLLGQTPLDCMKEVGYVLSISYDDYLKTLGKAITIWTGYYE